MPVFWDADLDTGYVMLQETVGTSGRSAARQFPTIEFTSSGPSTEGVYGVCGKKSWRMPVLLLGGASPDEPLAFVVAFGATSQARLTAVARFLSLQRGKMVPDGRLTTQRRQRLRRLLRCFDARRSGASHREIAVALFGEHRVGGPDWHESSLRFSVIRLVRDGAALVQGRYRDILQLRGSV